MQLNKVIASKKKDTNMLFVLDGSGSISSADFQIMKSMVGTLIEDLKEGVQKVGVIQFSDHVIVHQNLSKDFASVAQSVLDISQIHQGTNLDKALQAAEEIFATQATAKSRKVVFVITDGDSQGDPVRQALKMRFGVSKAQIIVVAVGSAINFQVCQNIASPSCAYKISNFSELKSLLTNTIVGNPTDSIPDYKITVDYTMKKYPVCLGQDWNVTLTVENSGKKDIPATPGLRILFPQDKYFMMSSVQMDKKLLVGETIELPLLLRTQKKNGAKMDEVSSVLKFKLDGNPLNIVTEPDGFLLKSEHLCGDLLAWKPPSVVKEANILIFGKIGSGKTSFLNGVITLFHQEVQTPYAVAKNDTHVTLKYTKINVNKFIEDCTFSNVEPNVKFCFWDTWGVTPSNYTSGELKLFLDGMIPDKFDLKNASGIKSFCDQKEADKRKIHAVLFVVPQGIVASDKDINVLKGHLQVLQSMGHMAKVVVTHMDESDYKALEMIDILSDKLGCTKSQVYPHTNYGGVLKKDEEQDKQDNTAKDMQIDTNTFRIMKDTLDQAKSYIQKTYD